MEFVDGRQAFRMLETHRRSHQYATPFATPVALASRLTDDCQIGTVRLS
jgi:hypothetical protein